MKLQVIIEQDETGYYVAEVPALRKDEYECLFVIRKRLPRSIQAQAKKKDEWFRQSKGQPPF